MRYCRLSLLLIAALSCAAPTQAQPRDPDLPAVDPPGKWRIMAHHDDASTSKCIGKPITPLCAVETVIACLARGENELCRIGMGFDESVDLGVRVLDADDHLAYRVLSARRFDARNLPARRHLASQVDPPSWYTDDRRENRPGDYEIVVSERQCSRHEPCRRIFSDLTYFVRWKGDQWVVLDWEAPEPPHRR
jgi:hypothetical protein